MASTRLGPRQDAVVLLLHGQPGSSADWDRVAGRLAPHGRVVAPDRPGYGGTASPARGIAANADAAIELLDSLGVASAVIVGHSFGGGIALDLAQRHPERVEALVLVAGIGPRASVTRFDRMLVRPVIGSALIYLGFRVLRRVLAVGWLRRRLVSDVARLEPRTVEHALRPFRGERVWRSFAVEQRALVEEVPRLDDRLDDLRTPVAVIFGTADEVVAPEVGEELAARLPGARAVRVRGAGHLLPQQHPDLVAEVIAETLRGRLPAE